MVVEKVVYLDKMMVSLTELWKGMKMAALKDI